MFNEFDNTKPMAGVVRRASSRALRGLVAAALAVSLVATAAWLPDHYWDYVDELDRAWIVLLRNLLLIALVAVLSLPARVRPRSS